MVRKAFAAGGQLLVALALTVGAASVSAGLFDDDEARKAILDLRTRFEQGQQTQKSQQESIAKLTSRLAEQQNEQNEQIAVLKRSLLELYNQLETLRGEIAKMRGRPMTSSYITLD